MRMINEIIVHCSASDMIEQDNVEAIAKLHTTTEEIQWGKYKTKGRGWKHIGYHFVITSDGNVHKTLDLSYVGSHCKGHNLESIGICLTGEEHFTPDQYFSLAWLLGDLLSDNPTINSVKPHNYYDDTKTCPNFKLRIFDTNKK